MSDTSIGTPDRPPAIAPPPPLGELLFEFVRDGRTMRCELHDHGRWGVEARFRFSAGAFLIARRFDRGMDATCLPRELAVQWAHEERVALERGVNALS